MGLFGNRQSISPTLRGGGGPAEVIEVSGRQNFLKNPALRVDLAMEMLSLVHQALQVGQQGDRPAP